MPEAGALPARQTKLRGWLLLVAIGVVIYPLRLLGFILDDLLPVFSRDVWSVLTAPGSNVYHPLNGPVLLFELLGNLVLLICSIILAVMFFQRREQFPFLGVSFLVGAFLFYLADYFAALQLPSVASQEDSGSVLDLAGALPVCAVLVPYFLTSKRVKATFVR
jgi:hypothetical protein